MISDYRHTWTSATSKAPRVRCWPLGDGERHRGAVGVWDPVILIYSLKHRASAISHRFSMRPWYHSCRAGPCMLKHASPTLSNNKNLIIYTKNCKVTSFVCYTFTTKPLQFSILFTFLFWKQLKIWTDQTISLVILTSI